MTDDWTFEQPQNCAVMTHRPIVDGSEPILRVIHDSDDHGWQFLGQGDAREEDASVVALRTIVELDPSVLEVAGIPPGWHAWRSSPDNEWIRELNPNDAQR